MSKSSLFYSRKRQHTEQSSAPQNEACAPKPKRQKCSIDTSHPPPRYWDKLSKIWLTKGALIELDRRNARGSPRPPLPSFQQHYRRPVTRNFRAKLEIFAQHGGPDLSDLRGHPEPIPSLNNSMSSNQSSQQHRGRGGRSQSISARPTTDTGNRTPRTKSSSAYSRNFEQNLIDHGILPEEYEYPDGRVTTLPNNWEEINERLRKPRSSLSPSQFSNEKFKVFKRADARAAKEDQVKDSVIPLFAGTTRNARCVSGGILWGNLEPLTDGMLKPAKPDFYEGSAPEQLNREVREQLSAYIVPSTQDSLPILPNFSLESKGPDGTAAIAERQAMYNGALGARALQILQSYGQDGPVYDNRAYTVSATYSAGQLKMFTTHLVPPEKPDDRPSYYRHQIKGWAMSSDVETFRKGATAFRNAREWAKEQRDNIIMNANEISRSANDEGGSRKSSEVLGECEETKTSIEEADGIDEDEEHAQAMSLSTLTNFAEASTSQLRSTQTEDESDTSAVERVRLSAKRSPSQSPKARRHKRKPGSRRSGGSE